MFYKNNLNKLVLTLICYLSYFFTGSIVTVTFVVIGPVAHSFSIKAGTMSYLVTFQNLAMWLAILTSGLCISKTPLRKLITIGILIEASSLLLLTCFNYPVIFSIFMVAVGFSAGVLMSIGSYLIIKINSNPKERIKQVLITEFFFSFSGVVMPLFAGKLISYMESHQYNILWIVIYYIILVVGLFLIFLSTKASFPDPLGNNFNEEEKNEVSHSRQDDNWGTSIYCTALSAFSFICAELTFSTWLYAYLTQSLNWISSSSGAAVSLYWLSKSIGLFLSPMIAARIALRRLLVIAMTFSTIIYMIFLIENSMNIIWMCILLFGLSNSVIYAGLISFGSLQVRKTSPKLIAFILTAGTTGTMVYPAISGFINNNFGNYATMFISEVAIIMCLLSFVLAYITSKEEYIIKPELKLNK